MSLSFARGSLRLFSSAIVDQVVLSGANFVVGFVLIRFTSDRDYGLFVLVQSTLLLLGMMHNAYLTGPLSVLTPKLPPEERWQTIGSVKREQRRLLRLVALPLLALPLLGYLSGLFPGLLAVIVATGILAGWAALRREYLRAVLLMSSRPNQLLRADTVYAGCLLGGVAVAVAVFAGTQIVFGATCTLVIAAWAGAAAAYRFLAIDPGWRDDGAVTLWPDIRKLGFWSLTGASIYWFLGQSYSYMLATRIDLTAVADVNATRLLLMPAIVLTVGVASLLGPTSATWYSQIGVHKLVRRLLMFLLVIGLLEIMYFLAVWSGRNWLLTTVLHKHIEDSDRLLILWGGVAIIALVRDVLQCALIAMGHLKSLAWQVGISAAVAVVLMWYGTAWWGAAAVLIGQIVGELINLTGIVLLLRKHMRITPAS